MNVNDFFTDAILQRFGEDYIKTLTNYLLKSGKRASGRLINSLDYRIVRQAEDLQIIIEGEDYLTYVDEGVDGKFTSYGSRFRYTNKMPPVQKIKDWCQLKGIPQSAAFPIAKNIFKFGIEPTNVIQETNADLEKRPFLETGLIAQNIERWLVEEFRKNN